MVKSSTTKAGDAAPGGEAQPPSPRNVGLGVTSLRQIYPQSFSGDAWLEQVPLIPRLKILDPKLK